MGINIHDPLVQIKVTESVCGFVAICMTLLRLWLRRDRYWWDDAWAFFSLLFLIIQFGAVFMHVEHPSDLSRLNRIAAYYLMAVTFYLVIWSARISILFSIIRIDPDPIMRRRLKWFAALFVGAIVFFLTQLFWTCETMHDGWKNKRSPQCHLPKQVAICQLVCTCLFTHTSRLPHSYESQPPQRTSLLTYRSSCCPFGSFEASRISVSAGVSFSSSPHRVCPLSLLVSPKHSPHSAVVTTIVSLVHAAYIITEGGIPVVISALVEDCMSLTVANVPVVATASFRRISSSADDDADGQRWSSFKFRTRTTRPPGVTTRWSTGFGLSRGGVIVGNVTEVTDTTLELSKNSEPPYSAGSLGPDEMFAGAKTGGKPDGSVGDVRREDRGVVRIDALPYPRHPLSPET
ncbi:hypothetical protein BJV78DRAFT_199416 [Lactifluus subvellereus]|nr:hypothetical protein BJV78DRAFT_199416 [Lactifluus subvellereus]